MDLRLLNNAFHYTLKRRKWLLLLASLGFTGYGAYKLHHSPSIALKRKRVLTLLGALISVAEAVSDSAKAIGVVSKDVKEFLQSESDEIPTSLKQISKITRTDHFSESVVSVTRALTVGIFQAKKRIDDGDVNVSPSFLDQVLDKLFTSDGSGFASVVVGSFARNLVMALYSCGESGGGSNVSESNSNAIPDWFNIVCSNKSRELIGDCIQLFVSTAVSVYLEKTAGINTYDELFTGLTNPNHERKVREMLIMVCNGATETLVKSSYQVFMSANSDTNSSNSSPCIVMDQEKVSYDNELFGEDELPKKLMVRNSSSDEVRENEWISKVSSTLALPSNRRLFLDATGRFTFETVRSFLGCLLEKFYDCMTSCANVVHEAFVQCGHGVIRYVTAKSSVLAGICLSLCLHILGGELVIGFL